MVARRWTPLALALLLAPTGLLLSVEARPPALDPTPVFGDGFGSDPNLSTQWKLYRASGQPSREGVWDANAETLTLTTAEPNLGVVAASTVPLPAGSYEVKFRYRATPAGDAGHGIVLHLARDMTKFSAGVATGPRAGFETPFGGFAGVGVHLDSSFDADFGDAGSTSVDVVRGSIDNHVRRAPDPRMADGEWHQVAVVVEGGRLRVRLDGDAILYASPTIGPDKGWGFSAATGSKAARHEIDDVRVLPLPSLCKLAVHDDFNNEPTPAPVTPGYTGFRDWLVTAGTFDLMAPSQGLEYESLYAFARGTPSDPARLESRVEWWIPPGTIVLRYAIAGGGGAGADTLDVDVGPLRLSHQVDGDAPWRRFEHIVDTPDVHHSHLTFEHKGGLGGGVRLDDLEMHYCNEHLHGCYTLDSFSHGTGMSGSSPQPAGTPDSFWVAQSTPDLASGPPVVVQPALGWGAMDDAQWMHRSNSPIAPWAPDGTYSFSMPVPGPPNQLWAYVTAHLLADDEVTLTVGGVTLASAVRSAAVPRTETRGVPSLGGPALLDVQNIPSSILPLGSNTGFAAHLDILYFLECTPGPGGGGWESPTPSVKIEVIDQVPTCTETHVTLDAVLTNAGPEYRHWAWTYGDGSGGSTQRVEHSYTKGGIYEVEVIVRPTDGYGLNSMLDLDVLDPLVCPDRREHETPPVVPPAQTPPQRPKCDLVTGPDGTRQCPPEGGDGNGTDAMRDSDGDGHLDDVDVCPMVPDDQADLDLDRVGDVCDPDVDGDGVPQEGEGSLDNCPLVANPDQRDLDKDGFGDACDSTPRPAATSTGPLARVRFDENGRDFGFRMGVLAFFAVFGLTLLIGLRRRSG